MKKQSIEYLFFTAEEDNRNKIELCEKEIAGIKTLQVIVHFKKDRKGKKATEIQKWYSVHERTIKRIKNKLKGYNLEKSVVGADQCMSKLLQIEDDLFQARKQELLINREKIMQRQHSEKRRKEQERSRMLLVIDSRKWSRMELRSVLFTAKDSYEEISVYCPKNFDAIMELNMELYEDWGVVLHIMKAEDLKVVKANFALLLIEEWKNLNHWKKISFHIGYVVADIEADKRIKRCREEIPKRDMVQEKEQKIYSGFVYERQGKQLYDQQGTNIAYQNADFYDEFQISIVAIYRLEW